MQLTVLGENIKKYRMKMKLTQSQLAERLYVSFQAISNWERGITPPDLENLCKLAALFQVSVDTLLGRKEQPQERCMIGIDGGGTKTEFVLFSESGAVLGKIRLGAGNPNDIGMENCLSVLTQGIDRLLEEAPGVCGIFAGIAGGTTGDNAQVITDSLKKRYRSIRIKTDTDAVNVISSSSPREAGMALICGTGSVLFAREDGKMHRIGGWGYLFDESGSAYDIGKDAIRAVLAQQDGLGPETVISRLMKEELNSEVWDCLNLIYQKGKSYIASLAPVVFRAASLQDETADRIIRKNALHLADLINTAQNMYHCGRDVVACGGLMENCREVLLPILQEAVSPQIRFLFPKLPPVYGACVECCHMMEIPAGESFYQTFSHDYLTQRSLTIC